MVLVVGDIGMGKSRILRELEERAPGGRRALYVPIPTLSFEDLATWCLVSLGRSGDTDPAEVFASEISKLPEGVLLLIDDADHLPPDTASRLGEITAASDGALAVVAASCPGTRGEALAARLGAEHRVVLSEDAGALLHLGEVHELLATGSTRAPMARAGTLLQREPEQPEPVARLAAPVISEIDEENDAASDEPDEVADDPEEPDESDGPLALELADVAGAAEAEAPTTRSLLGTIRGKPARSFPGWAKPAAAVFAAALFLGGSYELGRRSSASAPAGPVQPDVSAAPPRPAVAEVEVWQALGPPAPATPAEPAEQPAPVPEPIFGPPEPVVASAEVIVGPAQPIAESAPGPAPEPVATRRPDEAEAGSVDDAVAIETEAQPPVPVADEAVDEAVASDSVAPASEPAESGSTASDTSVEVAPQAATYESASAATVDDVAEDRLEAVILALEESFVPVVPPAVTPAVETAVPTGDGWIRVEIEGKERARVWIDGESAGMTPIGEVAAAPGMHRVSLRLKNGARVRREIEVRPERGTLVRVRFD